MLSLQNCIPVLYNLIIVKEIETKVKPFKRQPNKMVKHTNFLSVCDRFMGLAVKGLSNPFEKFWITLKRMMFTKRSYLENLPLKVFNYL